MSLGCCGSHSQESTVRCHFRDDHNTSRALPKRVTRIPLGFNAVISIYKSPEKPGFEVSCLRTASLNHVSLMNNVGGSALASTTAQSTLALPFYFLPFNSPIGIHSAERKNEERERSSRHPQCNLLRKFEAFYLRAHTFAFISRLQPARLHRLKLEKCPVRCGQNLYLSTSRQNIIHFLRRWSNIRIIYM